MKITALALAFVFLFSIVAPASAAGIADLESKVKSSKIGEEKTSCDPKTPCPPGKVCVDGVCVDKPQCDPNNPCPPGKVCVDGVCKDKPACDPNNPCPPGQTCVDGVCKDNPAGTGGDCPGGDCGKAGGFLKKIGDFFKKLFAPVIDFFKKIFKGGGDNGGGCTGPDCPPTTPIGPPPTSTPPEPPTTPTAPPETPATPTNPPTSSDGKVKTLTSANFGNEVLNQKGVVVVDLYATWCGPCKQFAPTYDRLARDMKDVKFGKVDVDQARDLYSRYGGGGVPTLVIFKDGKPVKKMTGGQNYDSFKKMVESYK